MFKRLKQRRETMDKEKQAQQQQQARPLFAMICANNVNRSTAAHDELHAAGLRVRSFGAGRQVCFPGATATTPRCFSFATPYELMHRMLKKENEALFRANGVLAMLERDIRTKKGPERWQSMTSKQMQEIDVVVCLDYRMFMVVLEGESLWLCTCATNQWARMLTLALYCALDTDLQIRLRLRLKKRKRMHIICMDTEDTPETAPMGATNARLFCEEVDKVPAEMLTEERMKDIVEKFEKQLGMDLFYLGLQF